MARFICLALFLTSLPSCAMAIEAPAGQVHIDATQILRGHFTEQRQSDKDKEPLETSGHFVVAPANGLIWGIEVPFPTATIVTPNGVTQELGGMAVKLPVKKNLRHLYDMIGGALAGNWNALESDFTITRSGNAKNWQMLLTARPNATPNKSPYSTITVSGSRFVENIVMVKANGATDSFNFSNATLSPLPLASDERIAFNAATE